MKKEACRLSILVLFAVLAMPLFSAVEVKLSKNIYYPQETLQAEITGNFIDALTKDNLLIYKQDIPRSSPIISDLTKQGEIYYFYAILPNQEGNFSLRVENLRYIESGVEKTTAIVKEFEINKTNQSALQINPGFVKTCEDFSVKVKSLAGNQQITSELRGESKNYSLIEDVEKELRFSVSSLAIGKNELKIVYGSDITKGFFSSITTNKYYTIPVFVIEKAIINNTIINQTNQTNANQTNQTANETKVSIENKTTDEIKAMHCSDFGLQCEGNKVCDVETKESLEGPCCLGGCAEKKGKSYVWIGILIILVVLAAVAFMYFKAKNKRPPSSEEILKTRTDKFDERMSGENREVSGRLDSI
jgi:hypothetical protein